MERFVFFAVTVAMMVSMTVAAPWVVLDSGSDMLAMSSEVPDSEVAIIAPPTSTQDSVEDDSVEGKEKQEEKILEPKIETEALKLVTSTITTTTEEPPQVEINPKDIATEVKSKEDITYTTESSNVDEKELTESTTVKVGAMVESDIKQEDMHIQVVPEPPTYPDQHPNSIEEDIYLEPIIVITKRKHFSKKYNF